MSKHKIHGRLGLTGSGKTLDQTERDVLAEILSGVEVWSTYWINLDLPNIHYFSSFEQIRDLRNCVVVFDEVTDIFDPREWEKEGSEVRRWFRLHRHHHIEIYFNTQDISLVAKTIGTLCHEWLYCKEDADGTLARLWRRFWRRPERVSVRVAEMTYQELKKMAAGWELGEQLEAEGIFKTIQYPHDVLIHHELDDKKRELVHRYCPNCEGRQGEQIVRIDTDKFTELNEEGVRVLKQDEFCPRDGSKLEIRESGVFDTDYDPNIEEVEIEWRAFVPIKEGAMMVPYKGWLSDRQVEDRKKLRTKF